MSLSTYEDHISQNVVTKDEDNSPNTPDNEKYVYKFW